MALIRPVRLFAAASILAAVGLPVLSSSAAAQRSMIPTVHPVLLAQPPAGATKPDDITMLDGLLYVTYQNKAGKDGSPPDSMSTIVAFDPGTGGVVTTYSVLGRCDGLTADPNNNRLLASVNEDNNSSLFVITPGDPVPAHFDYVPNPAEIGTDSALNGGTDAISVTPDGTIYVAHSNPAVGLDTAAVYTMTLDGSTAVLTRVFGVNDSARVINHTRGGPLNAPLGLTDPDSNRFLPGLRGGTLVQDAQADSKLVLATHLRRGRPQLRQLILTNEGQPAGSTLTPQLDDIEQVTGPGVLYAVDQKTGTIYSIDTTRAERGTFFVSQPAPSAGDNANAPALGVVDLRTGVVTPVDFTLGSPKGLLFVPARSDIFGRR
ncbi:MAG: hypothetical protein M3083_07560 [Actinomycetota bacterium]|nr:hypothetical protein [Actinomycetota bacterium]